MTGFLHTGITPQSAEGAWVTRKRRLTRYHEPDHCCRNDNERHVARLVVQIEIRVQGIASRGRSIRRVRHGEHWRTHAGANQAYLRQEGCYRANTVPGRCAVNRVRDPSLFGSGARYRDSCKLGKRRRLELSLWVSVCNSRPASRRTKISTRISWGARRHCGDRSSTTDKDFYVAEEVSFSSVHIHHSIDTFVQLPAKFRRDRPISAHSGPQK